MRADPQLERTRKCIELYLNDILVKSSLSNVHLTLRYVPIVMPQDMHFRYKERSRSRVKQRIYDCAPHLNYEIFIGDDFGAQIREYIRGIELSLPHLSKFGLSDEQIEEFRNILGEVSRHVPQMCLDQEKN